MKAYKNIPFHRIARRIYPKVVNKKKYYFINRIILMFVTTILFGKTSDIGERINRYFMERGKLENAGH